ncbi:cysteine desulfurase [Mesorhizobium sp. M2A.F.Ca.ET.037.01.1.1]|uniref:urate hydroxylase PuuD n=1 Tax=unclassified Mesorhizobium TaxID=325217 RepID=UPI000F75F657|nr:MULTISPECIES: urate hydroxylase PuuD [unclassified Mesorhizobium]RUY08865.1 cysteine desulfurase [Mesorhizobium sp. M2A.F.Ca.ET.040.01.1.1]RVC69399.1 cysteine desulfurase [Mesorhizobium sp. M00.F.Ca.ET.038.03.1.1]AZO35115.1 cysteine desulfurase [Mesorhizobium sp. M2A.F.Ca.ET.046.03.2.1]RUX18922.1 cysteine desulfurase [Mesorhizobium sp. M2A.F.Ca.ET.037.01.1.1]RWA93227.1 MAG: cysteine desulfurase [Mesorhizobium sp.]
MMDFAIFWDWLSFAVRWLHVITGIAWIGSSFYFVALDLGLRQRPGLPAGAFGEEWQVHGGGFYHIQKYLVAPAEMPEHLTWFKWESYATWLSGFAMLCVVYYAGADLFLIDPNVLNISAPVGILLSLATIGVGWIVYDLLCRSPLGKSDTGLMLVLYCVLVFIAWGLTHLFTGRAAFLHLGAITATIMSANVFMVIIPNQKIVVADLIAGRKPDPRYGKIAKQRSLHNNYLTLPVLFLMLSNHYPLAFGTQFNWVIASLVFIIGVLIRHYFNTVHARKGNPTWTWLGAAVLFMIIIWLSTVPKVLTGEPKTSAASAAAQVYIASAHFPAVRDTVLGRCSMCHTEEPVYEGIYHAPKGVLLDTDERIAEHAREIYIQAGRAHAMPPANVTQITDQERALLVAWFEGAGK